MPRKKEVASRKSGLVMLVCLLTGFLDWREKARAGEANLTTENQKCSEGASAAFRHLFLFFLFPNNPQSVYLLLSGGIVVDGGRAREGGDERTKREQQPGYVRPLYSVCTSKWRSRSRSLEFFALAHTVFSYRSLGLLSFFIPLRSD